MSLPGFPGLDAGQSAGVLVARVGDDEFQVVLIGMDNMHTVDNIARCIIRLICRPIDIGDDRDAKMGARVRPVRAAPLPGVFAA